MNFAKSHSTNFKIIETDSSQTFAYSIEKTNLFSSKNQITLKAIKAHVNEASYNLKVYSKINLWEFQFESTEKCNQTIDSLLNSFPNMGAPIKRNVNISYKITPSVFIFNEKSIYIAKTNCEHVDTNWENFNQDFIKTFAISNSQIIKAECGKLEWLKN